MTVARCSRWILAVLLGSPLLAPAAAPLDVHFGQDGLRSIRELGGAVQGLGSCPHADGSISIVGHRASTTGIVFARVNADGDLDPSLSEDGLAEFRLYFALDPARTAVTCAGAGNADPADDRIMIAATSPGTRDTAVLALVDLNTGAADREFGLGGPMVHDYSGLLFPPSGELQLPRLHLRGVHPGNNGEWLISGQMGGANGGEKRGFIARISAQGAVAALAQPNAAEYRTLSLALAKVGGDGFVRALGTIRNDASGQDSWGLLRLDGATLEFRSLAAKGVADGFPYEVMAGRRIGGGTMVAAALANDYSALGTSPRLLIVRDDQVRELQLPQPPDLAGVGVGVANGSATGAVGNRVVYAAGLRSASAPAVGYYVAMVQLGDGGAVADRVFSRFGEGGASSFRFRPSGSHCSGQSVPYQPYSNISSWGAMSMLVGYTQPDCDDTSGITDLLAVRVATDASRLFHDSFESAGDGLR